MAISLFLVSPFSKEQCDEDNEAEAKEPSEVTELVYDNCWSIEVATFQEWKSSLYVEWEIVTLWVIKEAVIEKHHFLELHWSSDNLGPTSFCHSIFICISFWIDEEDDQCPEACKIRQNHRWELVHVEASIWENLQALDVLLICQIEVLYVLTRYLGKGFDGNTNPKGAQLDIHVSEAALTLCIWVEDVPEELEVTNAEGFRNPEEEDPLEEFGSKKHEQRGQDGGRCCLKV